MLGDLLRGQEKSPLVIIEDTCNVQGRPLLISFINNLLQRVEQVVLITYEKPARYFTQLFPEIHERIHIVDRSDDPLGWQDEGLPSIDGDFLKIVEGSIHSGTGSVGIVIDSLIYHMLNRPPSVTCQKIHATKKAKVKGCDVIQTVCLLHSDLHDDAAVVLVRNMATSLVQLSPSASRNFQYSCSISHQRASGKVIKVLEHFNMDLQFNVMDVSEVKATFTMALSETQAPQPDPAANLSFNLNLTDKEKEARSQVKLPYVKDDISTDSKEDSGGQIFYQADEADDFDEEDPDDDLNV